MAAAAAAAADFVGAASTAGQDQARESVAAGYYPLPSAGVSWHWDVV